MLGSEKAEYFGVVELQSKFVTGDKFDLHPGAHPSWDPEKGRRPVADANNDLNYQIIVSAKYCSMSILLVQLINTAYHTLEIEAKPSNTSLPQLTGNKKRMEIALLTPRKQSKSSIPFFQSYISSYRIRIVSWTLVCSP
ncbi:hypothetical protein [Desulfosporosinus sp. BICA1-9]|uniref:hypothetical protein n=1 Tax=Desulfosporosinus sp. BICA1-9 TaxID=1531958 RepID=UPI00054B7E30|nr:hypothetical protein [Desulfosporosinus sp. BICA1-9]KJS46647.1 MAG: hypothetical protein VR66_24255 [Peptococcaceae bacterium BRH_c23]KJS80417.1 MAG: hypothetical protein JL57_28160 [Desulfosporosinus sp. BICA1-9]